jgi:predicted DNA-binding protein (UPF0278 family)
MPNIVLLAKELDGFFVTSPEAVGKLNHDLLIHYNMVHDKYSLQDYPDGQP